MKRKSGLSKFNIFLCVVLVLCIAATAYVIKTYPKNIGVVEEESAAGDVSVLETSFEAGTYGGVEFNSPEDVVNYYVKSFNYTKTLTAEYKENGETKTYYKLIADEDLKVENLLVEGKSSDIVNKLVPSILGQLFTGSPKGIPPAANRDRNLDERDDGPNGSKIPQQESHLTPDDVLDCNVEEIDAHTIKITIQPKGVILSMADQDSQGRFFNVLGDISSTVNSISVLSFSEGTIEENFVVNYQGGTGVVTIDTTTGEITEADYTMKVHIDVKHANVAVLKNKNASLDIIYTNHAPASDEFLLSSRNITR